MTLTNAKLGRPASTAIATDKAASQRRQRMQRTVAALAPAHSDCRWWLRRLRSDGATDAELERVLLMLHEHNELARALLGAVTQELRGAADVCGSPQTARCSADAPARNSRASGAVPAADDMPRADAAPRAELSERQRAVLALMADGLGNAAIAARLDMSVETAKSHVTRVLARLGAANRTHAVAIAVRQGLVQ